MTDSSNRWRTNTHNTHNRRPTFESLLPALETMRRQMGGRTPRLRRYQPMSSSGVLLSGLLVGAAATAAALESLLHRSSSFDRRNSESVRTPLQNCSLTHIVTLHLPPHCHHDT